METIEEIKVYPSQATFFLIELKTKNSSYLKKMLEEEGISIKDCSVFGLKPKYIRIDVPEEKDIIYVVDRLKRLLRNKENE